MLIQYIYRLINLVDPDNNPGGIGGTNSLDTKGLEYFLAIFAILFIAFWAFMLFYNSKKNKENK